MKHKKIIAIIFSLFFAINAFAVSFRPDTVKEMDADISLAARGSFSGEFSDVDSAELRMLTFNDSETQSVQSVGEKLFIGEKIIEPEYEFEKNNKIAVFKIENLKQFENDPSFIIELQARVKTNAKIELDKRTAQLPDGEQFLEATKFIESDDTELKSKAELEFTSKKDIELVKDIATWVHSNIEYDFENYYDSVYSAKNTYNSRKGVCDEFANLTAAFTRIKKIPTRYVTGISFDGERFGNHGWLEVFLDEIGWVGVDSTYLEAGYIDGAHFALATSDDPSNSVNLKITTKSINPIEVNSVLELPDVKINTVKFFENLTEANLLKPSEVNSKQEFEVKAVIKNNLNSKILIPVELAAHKDFSTAGNSRLELFEPFEEKNLSWKLTAPEKKETGYFYNYDLLFFTPDKNINDTISVFPTQSEPEEKSRIRILDISPFIEEKQVTIRVILENKGTKNGSAHLTLTQNENSVLEQQTDVNTGEQKEVILMVDNALGAELVLKIDSDESREVKIIVPKKQEDEIKIIEAIEPEKVPEQKNFFEENISLIITGSLVLIVIILTGLNFLIRKKSG